MRDGSAVHGQFARYVLVGGFSAVVDLSALWMLLQARLPRPIALAVALVLGIAINYLLHHRFTFRSTRRVDPRSIGLFLAIVGINYLLTLAIVEAGLAIGLTVMWSKLVSLPVIALNGFLFNRRFVF